MVLFLLRPLTILAAAAADRGALDLVLGLCGGLRAVCGVCLPGWTLKRGRADDRPDFSFTFRAFLRTYPGRSSLLIS